MSYLLISITAVVMKPSETKDTTIIRTVGDPATSIEDNKKILFTLKCAINMSFSKYEYCRN